jgi:hypothetical protein
MSNSLSREGQPADEQDQLSAVLAREVVDVSPSRGRVERLRNRFRKHDCHADTSTLDLQVKHPKRDGDQAEATLIGLCKQCDWGDFVVLQGEIDIEVTFAGDPKQVESEST